MLLVPKFNLWHYSYSFRLPKLPKFKLQLPLFERAVPTVATNSTLPGKRVKFVDDIKW